jgi:hypothetical protein
MSKVARLNVGVGRAIEVMGRMEAGNTEVAVSALLHVSNNAMDSDCEIGK